MSSSEESGRTRWIWVLGFIVFGLCVLAGLAGVALIFGAAAFSAASFAGEAPIEPLNAATCYAAYDINLPESASVFREDCWNEFSATRFELAFAVDAADFEPFQADLGLTELSTDRSGINLAYTMIDSIEDELQNAGGGGTSHLYGRVGIHAVIIDASDPTIYYVFIDTYDSW